MYRVGGHAHAQGITFESDMGRVRAYEDGRTDRVTMFATEVRKLKAALQKVPVLRVFPVLGKTGMVLLLLIVALLVVEVIAPQLLPFEIYIPDALFYGPLGTLIAAALLLSVLMRKRIRRLLQYHGAEHMAINTYRRRQPLTAENIAQADRATPSCGSVLALIFVIIALPLMFVPYGDYFMILAFGIAFELSVLARRVKWLRGLLRFGMAMQRKILTRPPDARQIAVARRGLLELLALADEQTKRV